MLRRVFDETQAIRPIGAEPIDPALMNGLDRHRIEIEPPCAAILLADEQARFFQHFEMVHNRDPADIERSGQLADGLTRLIADKIKNAPPRLMRKGMEDQIHIVISNHVITYLHVFVRVNACHENFRAEGRFIRIDSRMDAVTRYGLPSVTESG